MFRRYKSPSSGLKLIVFKGIDILSGYFGPTWICKYSPYFNPEDGRSMYFRNVNISHNYKVQRSRGIFNNNVRVWESNSVPVEANFWQWRNTSLVGNFCIQKTIIKNLSLSTDYRCHWIWYMCTTVIVANPLINDSLHTWHCRQNAVGGQDV